MRDTKDERMTEEFINLKKQLSENKTSYCIYFTKKKAEEVKTVEKNLKDTTFNRYKKRD